MALSSLSSAPWAAPSPEDRIAKYFLWALSPYQCACVFTSTSATCSALRFRGVWMPFTFLAPCLAWKPVSRTLARVAHSSSAPPLSGLSSGVAAACYEALSLIFALGGLVFMLEELGDPRPIRRWGGDWGAFWKAWAFSVGTLTTVGAGSIGGEAPKSLLGMLAGQAGIVCFLSWSVLRGGGALRWALRGGAGGGGWGGGGQHIIVGGRVVAGYAPLRLILLRLRRGFAWRKDARCACPRALLASLAPLSQSCVLPLMTGCSQRR